MAVQIQRIEGAAGVEVMCERERQAEDAGQLCAVAARPEQDDLRRRRGRRRRREVLPEPASPRTSPSRPIRSSRSRGKSSAPSAAGERRRAPRSAGRSRCPTQAEVDAARVQRFQRAELFGHHEGGWLGSMMPPDPTRMVFVRRRQVGHQYRRETCSRPTACCGARPPRTGGIRALPRWARTVASASAFAVVPLRRRWRDQGQTAVVGDQTLCSPFKQRPAGPIASRQHHCGFLGQRSTHSLNLCPRNRVTGGRCGSRCRGRGTAVPIG